MVALQRRLSWAANALSPREFRSLFAWTFKQGTDLLTMPLGRDDIGVKNLFERRVHGFTIFLLFCALKRIWLLTAPTTSVRGERLLYES
jgi:hypothetical protein